MLWVESRPQFSGFILQSKPHSGNAKARPALALLDVARAEKHMLQAGAKQLLGVYLGEDHGTNLAKWGETVVAWLKQNAG